MTHLDTKRNAIASTWTRDVPSQRAEGSCYGQDEGFSDTGQDVVVGADVCVGVVPQY